MKQILLSAALVLTAYLSQAQQTDKLLEAYMGVKNALVSGDSKAAAESSATLYQQLKTGETFPGKPELLKAADKLAKAGGIEKQREAFNAVSTNLWKLVKTSDQIKHPVYYQYCAMKKTYWISMEKAIKNPYYGASMLTCGKVVESK